MAGDPIVLSSRGPVGLSEPETSSTPDDIYNRFSPARRITITIVLSFCAFLAPISTTSILTAVQEVAHAFDTTLAIINISNSVYLVFMGISPCFWGPLGEIFGRRWICFANAILFSLSSVGTAMAPNIAAFFVFRALSAFCGTTFLVLGASAIGDVYHPTQRATALGWLLSGTMIGPGVGPVMGGMIVTCTSWRVIFWVQTVLGVIGSLLIFFGLPETIHSRRFEKFKGLEKAQQVWAFFYWANPLRVVAIFLFPNLVFVGLASSALVWNMYSLLTPIRHILNPRFDLKTPLETGLLYIAPSVGYLIGVNIGGRWADHTVRKWTKIRGFRLPEDRLRSSFVCMGIILPGAMVVYGWAVQKGVGGLPLPVICMVVQGIAQLGAFPCLNAYFIDVLQERSGEATSAHYMMRYIIAGISTSVCLPIIEATNVGWLSTISASFILLCTILVITTSRHGESWRKSTEKKIKGRK